MSDVTKNLAKGALLLAGVMGVGVAGAALGARPQRNDKRMKEILEVYDKTQDNPREWFNTVVPQNIPADVKGGRVWRTYPVRVNNEVFEEWSTAMNGVYLVDHEGIALFYPWDQVKSLGVSIMGE